MAEGLSRRGMTLLVSGTLAVALGAVAGLMPVPFVVLGPGPTENVLGEYDGVPVIEIDGHRTYDTDGSLKLTTVGVTRAGGRLSLIEALQAWVSPTEVIVPRESVYPEGTTPDQVAQANAEAMERSQETAKVAALREVGIEVPEVVVVDAVVADSPAEGRLRAGDIVRKVDGQAITQAEQVRVAITSHRPEETVVFEVTRDGQPRTIEVPTAASDDEGEPRTVVGIFPTPGYEFPFDVRITLGERIGGPSAGLMFALGIVDLLTPGALPGGRTIAGTGTIEADGTVGMIGGVQQKVVGARSTGATYFLSPAGNCEEAGRAHASGITVIPVETLAEAVDTVEAIAAGRTEGLARC